MDISLHFSNWEDFFNFIKRTHEFVVSIENPQNKLDAILSKVRDLENNHLDLTDLIIKLGKETKMDLTALTQEVNDTKTVSLSAITLLGTLSAKLHEIADNPTAIKALADQLHLNSASLAAAILANTPAVITEPPVVVPAPVDPSVP